MWTSCPSPPEHAPIVPPGVMGLIAPTQLLEWLDLPEVVSDDLGMRHNDVTTGCANRESVEPACGILWP